jgi:hypothetical protein
MKLSVFNTLEPIIGRAAFGLTGAGAEPFGLSGACVALMADPVIYVATNKP